VRAAKPVPITGRAKPQTEPMAVASERFFPWGTPLAEAGLPYG